MTSCKQQNDPRVGTLKECGIRTIRLVYITGFPHGSVGKEFACNTGDTRDAGLLPVQEDPLEKEMATHSSILAWRIPMDGGA